MTIQTAVQKSAYIQIYGEHGSILGSIPTNYGDMLMGFTSSTVTVRKGDFPQRIAVAEATIWQRYDVFRNDYRSQRRASVECPLDDARDAVRDRYAFKRSAVFKSAFFNGGECGRKGYFGNVVAIHKCSVPNSHNGKRVKY